LTNLGTIELWDTQKPRLYNVRVRLSDERKLLDHYDTRVGFREAKFTPTGFFLNDKHLKLRGLNRHQTYPYVGQAMPARGQKRDAWILRKELKCNIVRTSHYPQSPHFLDGCDEYGLLVFEEIPGWQHIGDQGWKDLTVQYVETMIKRDELIAEAIVPPLAGRKAAYLKFTARSADDWPALGVAVAFTADGDKLRDVRVVVSAATAKVMRLADAEAALEGGTSDEATLRAAGEAAAEEAPVIGDVRGSAAYKRELLRVCVGRAVRQALSGKPVH